MMKEYGGVPSIAFGSMNHIVMKKTKPQVTSMCKLFACKTCPIGEDGRVPSFATEKPLKLHMRVAHDVRSNIRCFIGADGVCPACKTCYHTRLRCLDHIRDEIRNKCKRSILEGQFTPLDPKLVDELDELDKDARRSAKMCGHTQPIATGRAIRPDGKKVGRVVQ